MEQAIELAVACILQTIYLLFDTKGNWFIYYCECEKGMPFFIAWTVKQPNYTINQNKHRGDTITFCA